MIVFKRRFFARWQAVENLQDKTLWSVINEMEHGLIDADLGGLLYKKRVARPGYGRRGGYRILLSARLGERYIFMHGFSKSESDNIHHSERTALQYAGKIFLGLNGPDLTTALNKGVLIKLAAA